MKANNIPLSSASYIQAISESLAKQIDKEIFKNTYAPIKQTLVLIGTGVFVAASIALPTLPMALRPFLDKPEERDVWKRFNIKYLKRTIERLEKQKLIHVGEKHGVQTVTITDSGRRRILRYALDELAIEKPKMWDGTWSLVSYDIPRPKEGLRNKFREYLQAWGFYPIQESVFLHAYPCLKEVSFLRDYLGIGEYVRLFTVTHIENDRLFREYFGV